MHWKVLLTQIETGTSFMLHLLEKQSYIHKHLCKINSYYLFYARVYFKNHCCTSMKTSYTNFYAIIHFDYFLCRFLFCCLAVRFLFVSRWCLLVLSRFLIISSRKRSRTICSGVFISPLLSFVRFFISTLRLWRFHCVVMVSTLRLGARKRSKNTP